MNECMVCKLQEERNSHHLEFTFPAFPLKPVGCFFKKHYSKFNLGFLNLSKWKIICLLSLCCLATLHTQSVISRYFYLEPISMLGLVSFRKYCCPKGLGSNFLVFTLFRNSCQAIFYGSLDKHILDTACVFVFVCRFAYLLASKALVVGTGFLLLTKS